MSASPYDLEGMKRELEKRNGSNASLWERIDKLSTLKVEQDAKIRSLETTIEELRSSNERLQRERDALRSVMERVHRELPVIAQFTGVPIDAARRLSGVIERLAEATRV